MTPLLPTCATVVTPQPVGLLPPESDPVAELLHAAHQGDWHAYARLYRLCRRELFNVVLRINKNPAEAEEVLQDVFLKAWTQSAQFDARKGTAICWLAGIARHGAIDSLRRRRVRPQLRHADIDADPYAGMASPHPQPQERLSFARATDAVRRCLHQLPHEQRESLTLAFYDGLSHEEIAHRLGRPLGTVKSWVRRSLALMRPALAGHGEFG